MSYTQKPDFIYLLNIYPLPNNTQGIHYRHVGFIKNCHKWDFYLKLIGKMILDNRSVNGEN